MGYHCSVPLREILRTPYFVIHLDESEQLVRMKRTSEPFPSLDAVRRGWLDVFEACDRAGRRGRCFLGDMRQGPARNDPAFEQIVMPLIPLVHRGFVRNAVLVKMAVGALQIKRHAKSDGVERLITSSEEEALQYLREGSL